MALATTGAERPIFVAVGGDSGSGKSTLTAGFYRIFPEDRITSLCLDDYHSLDRRERQLLGVTALNPRANNFALMENQLLALKRGESIQKPVYDHTDGSFGPPEEIRAKEVVVVHGLHPFLVPGISGLFDLKVWLDPEDALKRKWKVQRDVAKRGYTEEQVNKEIAARRPDVETYIAPQRRSADLVVRFFRPENASNDEALNVRAIERSTLPRLNLDGLLRRPQDGLRAFQEEDDGESAEVLEIDGRIDHASVWQLEDRIWDHIGARHQHLRHLGPDEFGDFTDGAMRKHHSDPLALIQLLMVHRILSAKKSMLLRVPLSVHESIIHDHQEEDVAHDHEHV
jgi:phosphoribulokinase